jgi:hypothetical protein
VKNQNLQLKEHSKEETYKFPEFTQKYLNLETSIKLEKKT